MYCMLHLFFPSSKKYDEDLGLRDKPNVYIDIRNEGETYRFIIPYLIRA